MLKPITIKEIARASGTSSRVVAEVLKGGKEKSSTVRFSEATRQRILAKAEELGYCPNYAASSLKAGRSLTIGHLSTYSYAHFWSFVNNGIEAAVDLCEYDMIRLAYREPAAVWTKAWDYLLSRRVDGLIVSCIQFNDPGVERLQEAGAPIIAVAPTTESPFPSVKLDTGYGASLAAKHLIGLGHIDLGWVGIDFENSRIREKSFMEACEDVGLVPRVFNVSNRPPMPYDRETWADYFLVELRNCFPLDEVPTGIACWSDDVALMLSVLLKERGLKVPEDVSIVGFDDLTAGFVWPPITTIRHMFPELGQCAVEHLINWIEQNELPPAPNHVWLIEPELVVRRSTAPPRR